MDPFKLTNRNFLFPNINIEEKKEQIKKALEHYRSRYKTEEEFEKAIEEIAIQMLFPYKWKKGRTFSIRPDNFLEVLYNIAKEEILEGRFAVYKEIYPIYEGINKYIYDETSKIEIKYVDENPILSENTLLIPLKEIKEEFKKKDENTYKEWYELKHIILDWLETGKTIEIPVSLEYEYLINSIFETLFYPHRVLNEKHTNNKDNIYAIGKLYSFRIIPKDEILQLNLNQICVMPM